MLRNNILLSFLFSALIAFSICLDGYERRFVFQISRHGARSSWGADIGPGVNDVLDEPWNGNSELTGVGMRQQYLLGYKSRQNYNLDNFLSKNFDTNEIYIVTTDFNRTIMSVNAQLNGLYPPSTGPVLTAEQQLIAVPPVNDVDFTAEQAVLATAALPNQAQVFPVHMFDRNAHDFYLHDANVCKPVKGMMVENRKNQTIVDFLSKFSNDYGTKLKNVPSLKNYTYTNSVYDDVYLLFDAFVADYTDKRALKSLTTVGIDLSAMNTVTREFMNNDMFINGFGDKDGYLGRMSMSPTFEKILNWTNTRISYDAVGKGYTKYVAPKVVLFSGHDTNLAAMQVFINRAFNRTGYIYPSYASSLNITLFRSNTPGDGKNYTSKDYRIQIGFNDQLLVDAVFDDFNKHVRASIVSPQEIQKFCGFDVPPQPLPRSEKAYIAFLIATIFLAIVAFLLIIYVIVLYRRHKAATSVVVNVDYNRV